MSTDRGYTKSELAQQAADQTDPAWLAWLADAPARADQLVVEIPGMPADPWTAEGLRIVEQYALDTFPDADATLAIQNRALAERIWAYLVELLVRTTEGYWRNVPENGDIAELPFGPVGSDDYSALYYTPITMLTALPGRAQAPGFVSFWVPIYERHHTDYKKWVAAGRPPRAEWIERQENEFWG